MKNRLEILESIQNGLLREVELQNLNIRALQRKMLKISAGNQMNLQQQINGRKKTLEDLNDMLDILDGDIKKERENQPKQKLIKPVPPSKNPGTEIGSGIGSGFSLFKKKKHE